MNRELVLVCGIPGCGKTTVAKELVDKGYVRLCRDEVKGGKGSMDDLLPLLTNALQEGKSVVMDNTFMTTAIRKPFIGLAMSAGVPVRCIELTTTLEEAQFNAVQRMIRIAGKLLEPNEIKTHKSPNIFPPAIQFSFRKNYEPPNELEGFSSIEKRPFKRVLEDSYSNKALILDYDGTLRDCVGGNGLFPTELDHVKVRPTVVKKIKEYADNGYRLLGVSNQSGIHKGVLSDSKARELFDHTNKLLGLEIEYVFCPHQSAPPICFCRKPGPGWGVHFIEKYRLSPKDCIFVGDMTTDRTFATRCGFQYVDQAEFFKETS